MSSTKSVSNCFKLQVFSAEICRLYCNPGPQDPTVQCRRVWPVDTHSLIIFLVPSPLGSLVRQPRPDLWLEYIMFTSNQEKIFYLHAHKQYFFLGKTSCNVKIILLFFSPNFGILSKLWTDTFVHLESVTLRNKNLQKRFCLFIWGLVEFFKQNKFCKKNLLTLSLHTLEYFRKKNSLQKNV